MDELNKEIDEYESKLYEVKIVLNEFISRMAYELEMTEKEVREFLIAELKYLSKV